MLCMAHNLHLTRLPSPEGIVCLIHLSESATCVSNITRHNYYIRGEVNMSRNKSGILTYVHDNGIEEQIQLGTAIIKLGRDDSCTVVFSPPIVSRLHAVIELREGMYILSDAGSANGTFVNGERIEQGHQLHSGDEIWLGSQAVSLVFADPEETLAVSLTTEPPALFVDEEMRTVQLYGVEVPLGPLEYSLLLYIASNPGAVCTREECFLHVWNQPYDPATCEDALNACIARLRRNLRATAESVGCQPSLITTMPRVGFRLDADVAFRLRGVYPRNMKERAVR